MQDVPGALTAFAKDDPMNAGLAANVCLLIRSVDMPMDGAAAKAMPLDTALIVDAILLVGF